MRSRDYWMSGFIITDIFSQYKPITAQYFLSIRIPYQKLLARLIHQIIPVYIDLLSCPTTGMTKCYLP